MDVTEDANGNTILFRVIDCYKGPDIIDILRLFIGKVNVNHVNALGDNALFSLVHYKEKDVVDIIRFFKYNRIDLDHENSEGKMVVDYFKSEHRGDKLNDIVRCLRD